MTLTRHMRTVEYIPGADPEFLNGGGTGAEGMASGEGVSPSSMGEDWSGHCLSRQFFNILTEHGAFWCVLYGTRLDSSQGVWH